MVRARIHARTNERADWRIVVDRGITRNLYRRTYCRAARRTVRRSSISRRHGNNCYCQRQAACNVDEILLYVRAAHDFAPLSSARMEGSIFDRRNNPFSPIALYFCIRRAVDHGAYRAFAPPSAVYARVKARVGLSGERLECEFPVKAGIY